MMQVPISSPDLNQNPFVRGFRRQSRRDRKSRQAKTFFQFRVENTFLTNGDQNQIPPQLSQQLQTMEYITPQNINKVGLPRRTSNFAKKLLQMKSIARKQQQKYNGMIIDSQKKIELIEEYSNPLNLHEDDEISLKLENFYDEKEHLDDFDIFNGGYQQDEEVVFYSNHELEMNDEYGRMQNKNMDIEGEETSRMDEEFDNYFN